MSLPTAVGTCIVTGTWLDPNGSPAKGYVSFRLTQQLIDAPDHVIIVSAPVTVALDAAGKISVALPYTDNTGVQPSGFSYEVTELLPGGRCYFIQLPTSTGPTVDISTLVPSSGASQPVWANAPFARLDGATFTGPVAGLDPTLPAQFATMGWVIAHGGGGGGAVSSVNGQTGVVVLGAADVGAVATVNGHPGPAAVVTAGDVGALAAAANLSDVNSAATSRTNLGLGNSATRAVGTTAGTVAAGDDSRITGAVQSATVTTKGDVLAASAPGTVVRVGVGADATVLTADTASAGGVKWSALPAPPTTLPPNGPATGDLGGSYPAPTVTATHLAAPLPVAQGGTGSSAQTWVDLTGAQSVGGVKTFTASPVVPTPTTGGQAVNKTYADALTGAVSSVNGHVGVVVLAASDVGALAAASNLSDVANAGTARTNLGLGNSATRAVGTTAGTVAAGDDSRITGAVQSATVTTKGDVLAASAAGTVVRVGVGADATVLTADTASAAGVKWSALPAAPTTLPPNGPAGGDLSGTYPNPTLAATANVNGIVRASRLDQMAAPTAALPMNGQKITGGAVGVASTDFVIVSQLPTTLPPNGAAGGDLGSTYPNPQVTATHLAAPLPVAQGGTGSATQNWVDLTTAQTAAGNKTFSGNLDCTAHAFGIWTPRESGLLAATGDPRTVPSGTSTVNGTIYLSAMFTCRAGNITKIFWGINTAGVTATAGANWIGLVDPSGTVIASVGVDAKVTTTGLFTETISSQAITAGSTYRVAFLFNATTPPQVYRHNGTAAAMVNVGIASAANYLHATNGTGQTVLPASFTLSSNASTSSALFGAIQ